MTAGSPPGTPAAFCDANVLYPSLLRDLLIRLDIEGLCRLHWSDEVNEEWINALVRDRGMQRPPLDKTRQLMDTAVPHARVTGFQHLIPSLNLPDADDRHVLAAALHSGAPHLITFNLGDFPVSGVPGTALKVTHPDGWLASVLQQDLHATCRVLQRLVAPLRNPPLTIRDASATLEPLRLPRAAKVLYGMLAQGIC